MVLKGAQLCMTLSESLQNHILSLCDESVIVIDTQFRIVEVNDELLSFTGSSRKEWQGKPMAWLAKPSIQRTLQQSGFWYGKLESEIPIDKLDNLWCSIVAYRQESTEITHYIGVIDHLWQENNFIENIASWDSQDAWGKIEIPQGSERTVRWIRDLVRIAMGTPQDETDLSLSPYGEMAQMHVVATLPYIIQGIEECVCLLAGKFAQNGANERVKE